MRKISDIYDQASTAKPVFSFEFFPPKNPDGEETLYNTIERLKDLHPDFVSVTYGAGGSTRGKTLDWVSTIKRRFHLTAMPHFTCVGASRDSLLADLQSFADAGINNVMALRGDPPRGETEFKAAEDGFSHASDLIQFIRSSGFDFSIGGACYPEKHPEAHDLDEDIENLKKKVNAGADFLITQLFFRNEVYFSFVEKCRSRGISVPIIPGIMPITSFSQIERFTSMAGCTFPEKLLRDISEAREDQKKLLDVSIEFSVNQCRELIEGGVRGIHFYTLNQSKAAETILRMI